MVKKIFNIEGLDLSLCMACPAFGITQDVFNKGGKAFRLFEELSEMVGASRIGVGGSGGKVFGKEATGVRISWETAATRLPFLSASSRSRETVRKSANIPMPERIAAITRQAAKKPRRLLDD
jgi:hypothetical protein